MKKSVNTYATLALLASMFAGLSAFSATYYVAPPPTGNDGNAGTQDAPFATIQKALDCPNSWGGTIYINAGTYKIDSALEPSSNGLTIRSVSGNPADVIIDAQEKCRCFFSSSGYDHYLVGLTFINGVADNGGAVKLTANDRIEHCVFTNCTATAAGGAIYASSPGNITDARIIGCSAQYGGGLYINNNGSSVSDCMIIDCRAEQGGGLYAYGQDVGSVMSNVVIRGCRAELSGSTEGGGAVARYYHLEDCKISDCHVDQQSEANYKTAQGGGVLLYNSTMSNSTVTACSVTSASQNNYTGYERGGGIATQYYSGYPYKIVPQVVGCTVKGCSVTNVSTITGVTTCGGGIGVSSDGTLVADCDISGNVSTYVGGGLGVLTPSVTVRNCTLTNNVCATPTTSAASGGSAIYIASGKNDCVIDGCHIEGNTFAQDCVNYYAGGSAVWLAEGAHFLNSAVIGNSGATSVGFQWSSAGNVLVSNCLFKANHARLSGGGNRGGLFSIYDLRADSIVTHCRFVDNESEGDHASWAKVDLSTSYEATLHIRNCLVTGTKGCYTLFWGNSGTSTDRKIDVSLENCTIVSNSPSGQVISPYFETAAYTSREHVFVKGCAILFNNDKPAFDSGYREHSNVSYTCAEAIGTQGGNIVYDPAKPLFADLANDNFRPAAGSQLLDVVPKADWMGDGTKHSTLDLGTGYELQETGGHGTKVVWTDARPRLFGDLADIGCCEYYLPPGMMLLLR